MRYSLGDLNPKRDPSPEQKRNDHLGDSGIALSANGDEDGRSAVSRASTANTEVRLQPRISRNFMGFISDINNCYF